MQRILIIDDIRDRAAWLRASLELASFQVVGVLAWEQVNEQSIQAASADVIIVDANAPGRDTLEQISLMSKTLEKPVVVLGAQKDPHSIQAAMRAGVSAYVALPSINVCATNSKKPKTNSPNANPWIVPKPSSCPTTATANPKPTNECAPSP